MARSAKIVRSGPGYVGLIVFIVLCVVLIIGYVFLFPAFAKRGSAVIRLNSDINANLEQPLGRALGIRASATASPTDAAYDLAFFAKVRDAAQKGIKYDDMVALTGYEGETPLDDIEAELSKLTPKPATLREQQGRLRLEITTLQGLLSDTNKALDETRTDRDNTQRAKVAAEERLKTTLDEKNLEMDVFRKKTADELTDLKDRWQKADVAEKKARADAAAEAEQFKKQISDLNDNMKALEQKTLSLREELERKKPKPVPVLEGVVLRSNLVEGTAYISIGSNQRIQMGEKFNVVTVGKGGVRVQKGEVQVVGLHPEFSRVDILGPAFESPIIAGDVVVREKKFDDAAESAAPAEK